MLFAPVFVVLLMGLTKRQPGRSQLQVGVTAPLPVQAESGSDFLSKRDVSALSVRSGPDFFWN